MLITLLAALLAFEVVLPILLVLMRDRMLFFPDATPASEGMRWIGPGVEAVLVDERALDVRPAGAPDAPVLLFLHGNAGCLADRMPLAADLARGAGMRVVMLEYTGFGGRPGSPSEEAVVADGLAGFDRLVASGVGPEGIVLYGESIGGAVALAVAARRKPAGVIVQSTFSSLSSMALRVHPWMPLAALLVRGDFRSVDHLREYGGPVLVVHGRRDTLVPFAEGEALAAAGGGKATLLPVDRAGHNDLFGVGGREYLATIGEWVRTTVLRTTVPGTFSLTPPKDR